MTVSGEATSLFSWGAVNSVQKYDRRVLEVAVLPDLGVKLQYNQKLGICIYHRSGP